MRRIFLWMATFGIYLTATQAQNSVVKAAERLATDKDPNYSEAQRLIGQALSHSETKDQPYAWYVAGLIEHQRSKQELKKLVQSGSSNEDAMYTALIGELPYWFKVDSLERITSTDKYSRKIRPLLEQDYKLMVNAGEYFLKKKNYAKSAQAFESYLKTRQLPLMSGSKAITAGDDTYKSIAYFATSSAYEAKDYAKAIRIGSEYKSSDYRQDELYQLLAASYYSLGDKEGLLAILQEGLRLFPNTPYYTDNLINYYIVGKDYDRAISLLIQAVGKELKQPAYYTALGRIYEEREDWQKSVDWYKKALEQNTKDVSLNYAVGRVYYNIAISKLNQSISDRLLEGKAKEYFRQSIPYLEQAYWGGDKTEELRNLLKNVYYRLGMDSKIERLGN